MCADLRYQGFYISVTTGYDFVSIYDGCRTSGPGCEHADARAWLLDDAVPIGRYTGHQQQPEDAVALSGTPATIVELYERWTAQGTFMVMAYVVMAYTVMDSIAMV